jgi:hypothetical protein
MDCESSEDCTLASEPICDGTSLYCRACLVGAAGDSDCTARDENLPRCTADGTCVQCVENGDCSGFFPHCDTSSYTCRACEEHSECDSEICERATGACIPLGDIIYVATNGVDSAGCGAQAAACQTIDGAQGAIPKITASRRWIRVRTGTFAESVTVTTAIDVAIIGAGAGATVIDPPASNVPGVLVDNGADVTLESLTVSGATGTSSAADGVRCDGGSSCTLRRVTIQSNADQGIENQGNALIEDSQVLDNAGNGVLAISGGAAEVIEIKGTLIKGNDIAGVVITQHNFRLTNNIIVENGNTTNGDGGVWFVGDPPGTTKVLEFNTIANNLRAGSATVSGIRCSLASATIVTSNNIVWGNTADEVEVGSGCTYSYSDLEGGGVTGTGNINSTPAFGGPTGYHITSGSPCKNNANPGATVTDDYDGQARGAEGRSDIGADEFYP